MFGINRWRFMVVAALGVGIVHAAELGDKGEGRLKLVEAEAHDELETVVSTAISADGKFLYAASWGIAVLNVYARDLKTGTLENKQTIADPEDLAGASDIELSPDGRLAIAVAFQSKAAILYLRNPGTGELKQLDIARDGENGVRMEFPVQGAFSPDSRFVAVLDDAGEGGDAPGALLTFRVDDTRLKLVGIDKGKDGCYSGARGLAFQPGGKTLLVASYRGAALTVADRDGKTGTTCVRQVIKDGQGGAHGLVGAFGVVISPDGRHIYVSSGRFGGANAVSAFRLTDAGEIDFIQEFIDGQGELQGFLGGNHLAVSPDGLNVYAAATRSGSIASFRRDPASGKLTYLETIPDCGEGGRNGAAGISISPDNKFVYVATEDKKAISIFKRDGAK
jgi:6-phosphogluconolactonase (cycloisomerase 2 family)